MSTLFLEEPSQELTSNSTRRLALLIPLSYPGMDSSSLATNGQSTNDNSSSRPRGVLLLVLTVPSSYTGGLGNLGLGNSTFNFGGSEVEEENEFQEILNRLLQNFQPRGPPPASKEFVDTLPLIQIDEITKREAIRCPVCLLDFELEEEALKLPCNHLFHQDCIKTWLKQANTCCVCRHELPPEEEETKEVTNEEEESSDNNSEAPELVSEIPDFSELPSLEDLFSLVPEARESLSQFVQPADYQQVSVEQQEVVQAQSPSPLRVLEDDLPIQRRRGGPLQWIRRQLSSVSCFRGFFS